MILQRCELEQTYLRHQLRQLRLLYPGTLKHEYEPVTTDGFYDDYRLMVHCPEMQRVYELLYPRDEHTISPEALAVAGEGALRSLWVERGRSDGKRISFTNFRRKEPTVITAKWLKSLGYGNGIDSVQPGGTTILFDQATTERFAREIYPKTHITMRKGLRSGRR